MKKIDKAWEMNLVEAVEEVKYKFKEEIVNSLCPESFGLEDWDCCADYFGDDKCAKCWNEKIEETMDEYTLNKSDLPYTTEGNLNCGFYPYGNGLNITIDDLGLLYPQATHTITNEDRFNMLRQSPICGICLNNMDVEQLKRYLKTNHEDGIIHIQPFDNGDEETSKIITLQCDDIPKLIKWLEDVYNLATNLKAEIDKEEKYTNFYLAREHMHKGGKCEYEGKIYYIFNGVMYLEFSGKEDKIENRVAYLSLEDIDSLEWLMLDK